MNELYIRFGELLKLERERRGMAPGAVSAELKIPEETLLQIESGQSDALPAGPYLALFSRSYAEFLGIDYAKTIEAIREDLGEALEPPLTDDTTHTDVTPEEDKQAAEHTIVDARTPRKKVGLAMGGTVVVIAILVGIFLIFWGSKYSQTSQSEGLVSGVDSSNLRHDTTGDQPDLLGFGDDSTAHTVPDSLRLTITAHDGSWATVLADADTALFQMLTPERPYNVSAGERLVVTIGVPEVVDMLLDGYPASLANPTTGDISRVLIDHGNRDRFYNQLERDSAGGDSAASVERTGSVRQ